MLGVFVALAHKSEPGQVIIGKSEGGQVNISLLAIDSVVHKAVLSVTVIRDLKTRIKAVANGVSINLKIAIAHNINVPETATAVQNAVKEQVQSITGLNIAEVNVLIVNIEGK